MKVELGNDTPVGGGYAEVATLDIPDAKNGRLIGIDMTAEEIAAGDEGYVAFEKRDEEHRLAAEKALSGRDAWQYAQAPEFDDERFATHESTKHIAETLSGITDETQKSNIRRAMLQAQMSAETGSVGLPDHEAFVAIASPNGFWQAIASPGTKPAWVAVEDYPALEEMLADYYDCPRGKPDNVEDTYTTRSGSSLYPPGARPDPLSGFTALHTTRGRVQQAIQMFGFGPATLMGVGTATAATSTTLTGSAETNASRAANECAGMLLVVGPNASGTGSKVYGLIISHTSGTTPVYTVDRWYNEATPGGSAGTTPNATSLYSVVAAPPTMFVALSTDTTAKSLGGTAGTADSSTIAQALTGEITTAGGGLIRKIAPIGNSGASVTLTPVFTANGTDSLPVTVGTAAASASIVATNGALDYMTLVSPTATMSASGDQLTLTWTMTET